MIKDLMQAMSLVLPLQSCPGSLPKP